MWKSGITFRHRSSCRIPSVVATLRADVARWRCARGTIFGRAVVPDVWRTRASAAGSGSSRSLPFGAPWSSNAPAGDSGSTASSSTVTPSDFATSRAGVSSSRPPRRPARAGREGRTRALPTCTTGSAGRRRPPMRWRGTPRLPPGRSRLRARSCRAPRIRQSGGRHLPASRGRPGRDTSWEPDRGRATRCPSARAPQRSQQGCVWSSGLSPPPRPKGTPASPDRQPRIARSPPMDESPFRRGERGTPIASLADRR